MEPEGDYRPGGEGSAVAPETADAPPKDGSRRQALLIVVAGLAVAGVALLGFAALSGLFKNPFESPERQKIRAAAAFFEAVSTSDAMELLGTIPNDAVGAGDGDFWLRALKDSDTKAKLASSEWTADVLTQVYTASGRPDTKAAFVTSEGDRVQVGVSEGSEAPTEPTYFVMVKEISGWKVRALVSEGEEFMRFDAAFAKELREQEQGQ